MAGAAYADMDWDWAVQNAKLLDRQNRPRIRRNLSFSSGFQVSRLAPFWKAPGIRGGAGTIEACQGGYSLPPMP